MNAYKKEPVVCGFDAYKDAEQLSKIIFDSMYFVRILKSLTLHVHVCRVYISCTNVSYRSSFIVYFARIFLS